MMTPSIIMPTIGRRTLKRALDSVLPQLGPGDEVIVIGDGPQPKARIRCARMGCDALRYYEHGPTRCVGNAQRQYGLTLATGDCVAFLDDDDVYLPGALTAMRYLASAYEDAPILCRFIDRNGAVLWADPIVKLANVGTAMILFPRRPEYFGTWKDVYEGAYWFIRTTLDKWPGGDDALVWAPHILTDARRLAA